MSNSSPPPTVRNVLFIMADQLRWDYLSCAGHPRLHTPNLDALARTRRALRQRLRAGPRVRRLAHVHLHRALRDEPRLDVELRAAVGGQQDAGRPPAPARRALRGGRQDACRGRCRGAARLGLDTHAGAGPAGDAGRLRALRARRRPSCPPASRSRATATATTCARRATQATTPGTTSRTPGATHWTASCRAGRCARPGMPARVAEEHSETAVHDASGNAASSTSRASGPGCCTCRYIKPHWPYVAPAPYHALYSAADVLPARRGERERAGAAPCRARPTWTPNRAEASPATKCAIR